MLLCQRSLSRKDCTALILEHKSVCWARSGEGTNGTGVGVHAGQPASAEE